YPRLLQAGDELPAKAASGAPERRIELPSTSGPIRVVLGPQDDEFADEAKALFLDSEWKISATSDRMGYRLEGPVIKHSHGHNIVSDGTVDGSRFAQTPAGTAFRFKAVGVEEAQAEAKKFAELLRSLSERLRDIENFEL